MKTSLLWISDYVEINVDSKDFAHKMTMSGSKVETVEELAGEITGIVIGKILSTEKHPDADKLRVCSVDIGSEVLQIVTGAQNVNAGDLIPLATVGANLPGDFKIKKGKLRGVDSFGMMCSVEELGLSVNDVIDAPEDGVYVFNAIEFGDAKSVAGTNMNYKTPDGELLTLGDDAKKAFGLDQVVVDFEITPNRPDCLSVYGIALEAAATYGLDRRKLNPVVKELGNKNALDLVKVNISAPDLCTRFIARVISDVKIGPSPKWIRDRLMAAGVRSINNIVDITNFVMLELGQPMHAYDARDVEGWNFNIRRANDNEKMFTLDDQERTLNSEMLVIADSKKAIGVAGVMGGQNSEIKDDTATVIFEAAMFNGASVRQTAKKLGLRTEASGRFEKGLDVANVLLAMNRACELVELLECGKVEKGLVDVYPNPILTREVAFDANYINKFLGTNISTKQMIDYLKLLEFEPNSTDADNVTSVKVPFARQDVVLKADLAEEIARLYDYNNIPPSLLDGKQTTLGQKTFKQQIEDLIIESLNACGLDEIVTYSFGSPKAFDLLNMSDNDPMRNAVVISNPLGEDYSIMRTTVVGDMLTVLARNANKRIESARLFEIAKVYVPQPELDLPNEKQIVSIGMYGNCDFYDIKGVVEQLFSALSIAEYSFEPLKDNPTYHPGRTAQIFVKDILVGKLGEIHPIVSKNYESPTRNYVAEIDMETLVANANNLPKFTPLPKFPATTRDLAIIVDDSILVKQIDDVFKAVGGKLLEKAKLFDVYKGAQLPENKKSVAYSLSFRANDRTLTDEDVSKVIEKIKKELITKLGAEFRM